MAALASVKYHYFQCNFAYPVTPMLASRETCRNHRIILRAILRGGHFQTGSLAGAAHLLKDNAGVLRRIQRGQKPYVDQKGTSLLDNDLQCEY